MPFRYLLGGADLEMRAIRKLLERHAPGRTVDHRLSWGANASSYLDEILASLDRGETPVLIELGDDLPPSVDRRRLHIVDHHGDDAGSRPTALEQVFALLALPPSAWTRWHALVAANDRGHVRGMQQLGATATELRRIRAADRCAQGVTAADERAAKAAIRGRETRADGALEVVHVASQRVSPVADAMDAALGGPGYENLLVVATTTLTFFGDGRLVAALRQARRGADWCGGELPQRGYWGTNRGEGDGERAREVVELLDRELTGRG